MMWGPWGGNGWWGLGMGIGSLLFLALIVIGVVLVFRSSATPEPRGDGRTAGDILEERFARGEIDAEEYEERRRVLGSSGRR